MPECQVPLASRSNAQLLRALLDHVILQLGQGVACLQIRPHAQKGSKCFHVVRPDGTFEDFSILKTIAGGQPVHLLMVTGSRLCTAVH